MPGVKFFTNLSAYTTSVTLHLRAGDDPRLQGGTTVFVLEPKQGGWQTYGGDTNGTLDALALQAVENGEIVSEDYVVLTRGSLFDEELNDYNAIDIDLTDTGTFVITPRHQALDIHHCHMTLDGD